MYTTQKVEYKLKERPDHIKIYPLHTVYARHLLCQHLSPNVSVSCDSHPHVLWSGSGCTFFSGQQLQADHSSGQFLLDISVCDQGRVNCGQMYLHCSHAARCSNLNYPLTLTTVQGDHNHGLASLVDTPLSPQQIGIFAIMHEWPLHVARCPRILQWYTYMHTNLVHHGIYGQARAAGFDLVAHPTNK